MNTDQMTMAPRPKSVTVFAITFGFLAGYAFAMAVVGLLNFALHPHLGMLLKAMVALVMAKIYAAIAAGLWRLAPEFRIPTLIIAALHTLAVLAIQFTPEARPPIKDFDVAMWIGYFIGFLIVMWFFAAPILVLTRPVVMAAFGLRPGPPPVNRRRAPDEDEPAS
jgi:hypothetical protein